MLVIALTLLGVWGYTVCTDDVTKETESALAKLTFLLIQGDSSCLEALKHGKKSLLVFLLVFPMDDGVIHQAQNTGQVVRVSFILRKEVSWGTGDTKGHPVETKWGDESHQMARLLDPV